MSRTFVGNAGYLYRDTTKVGDGCKIKPLYSAIKTGSGVPSANMGTIRTEAQRVRDRITSQP
jgi:hypothetical protein